MDRADDVAGAGALLELSGDVDTASVPAFRASADEMLANPDLQRFAVDLGAVEFSDSMCIGLLVHIRTVCIDRGIALELRRVPHRTRLLLELTGLVNAFRIVDAG